MLASPSRPVAQLPPARQRPSPPRHLAESPSSGRSMPLATSPAADSPPGRHRPSPLDCRLQRCNNPDKGIKCNHVRFRKQGPKHLEDLHILFDKTHVSGATASYPDDISSSSESSDEDVAEVPKKLDNDDVKLAALKKAKSGKRKCKDSSTATIDEKDEKSPFFRMYKNTCLKIKTAAEKICTSVEASSAPPANQVPSIKEAMQTVKDYGVQEKLL